MLITPFVLATSALVIKLFILKIGINFKLSKIVFASLQLNLLFLILTLNQLMINTQLCITNCFYSI